MAEVKTTFKAEVNRIFFRRVELAIMDAIDSAVDATLAYGVQVAKKHAPVRKVTLHGGKRSFRQLSKQEYDELPDALKEGIDPETMTFTKGRFAGRSARVVVRRSLASRFDPGIKLGGQIRTLPTGAPSRPREGQSGRNFRAERSSYAGGAREIHRKVSWLGETEERKMASEGSGMVLSHRGKAELKGRIKTSAKNPDAAYSQGGRETLGGRLRGEITAITESGPPIVTGALISPTPYARYVEFPTSRTAAQPYMRPARDAMRRRLPEEIERAIDRVVRGVRA